MATAGQSAILYSTPRPQAQERGSVTRSNLRLSIGVGARLDAGIRMLLRVTEPRSIESSRSEAIGDGILIDLEVCATAPCLTQSRTGYHHCLAL
jgi:hypothetical protein